MDVENGQFMPWKIEWRALGYDVDNTDPLGGYPIDDALSLLGECFRAIDRVQAVDLTVYLVGPQRDRATVEKVHDLEILVRMMQQTGQHMSDKSEELGDEAATYLRGFNN